MLCQRVLENWGGRIRTLQIPVPETGDTDDLNPEHADSYVNPEEPIRNEPRCPSPAQRDCDDMTGFNRRFPKLLLRSSQASAGAVLSMSGEFMNGESIFPTLLCPGLRIPQLGRIIPAPPPEIVPALLDSGIYSTEDTVRGCECARSEAGYDATQGIHSDRASDRCCHHRNSCCYRCP